MKDENNQDKKLSFKKKMKDPKKRILYKLGGWLIFFISVYLFVGISAIITSNNKRTTTNQNTKSSSVNFSKMKKNILNDNLNVKYKFGDYYIEGIVQNNLFNGTLEGNDNSLVKIKYDGTNLYKINKQDEVIDTELLSGFNLNYMIPSYIINLISGDDLTFNKSSDGRIYSYSVDNKAISFYLNEKNIEKIIVLDNNITYSLEYVVIG